MKRLTALLLGTALVLGTASLGFAADQPNPTTPAPAGKTKPAAKHHRRGKKPGKTTAKTPVTPAVPAAPAK